jgi:hypothetical protein
MPSLVVCAMPPPRRAGTKLTDNPVFEELREDTCPISRLSVRVDCSQLALNSVNGERLVKVIDEHDVTVFVAN